MEASGCLSAESMMIYCQTQLSSMDSGIQAMIEEQKAAIHKKDVLNRLQSELTTAYDMDQGGQATKDRALAAFDAAIAELPEGDPVRVELEQHRANLDGTNLRWEQEGPDGATITFNRRFAKEDWDDSIQIFADMKEKIGDDAEIRMIQMQSLMSARQTAVSLTTNMLNRMHQTEKGIVDNIR
jgi:hypothetical protein